MSQSACPNPEELSRQVSLGPDEQLSAHLDSCQSCAQAFSQESSVVGLFQNLSFGEPDALQVDRVKQSILQKTAAPIALPKAAPAIQWRRWAMAAAILLAVGATIFLSTPGHPPTQKNEASPLANVLASADAQYKYDGVTADEVVRLQNGTVTVQVQHLAPGQRFRVITSDAEVEVRGTRFDVTAKDDKLVGVVVYEGKVEVRPATGEKVLLLPSQTWDVVKSATTIAATSPTTLATTEDPDKTEEPRGIKKPVEPKAKNNVKAAEEAFSSGVSLMSAKSYDDAAESFSLVLTLDPTSPLAEDARFFYAFALFRAGKASKAKSAFTSYVAKYPNSSRRGEAAIALGQIHLESGDLDDAQIMFESAADDPSDAVKKSASAGLAKIAKLRKIAPTTQP